MSDNLLLIQGVGEQTAENLWDADNVQEDCEFGSRGPSEYKKGRTEKSKEIARSSDHCLYQTFCNRRNFENIISSK